MTVRHAASYPLAHDGDLLLLLHELPPEVRAGSGCHAPRKPDADQERVPGAAPVDKVWQFFGDIPQVAACLPGTERTDDLGGDKYEGWWPSGWDWSGSSSPGRPTSPSGTRRPSASW
jgi:hypothetical protein